MNARIGVVMSALLLALTGCACSPTETGAPPPTTTPPVPSSPTSPTTAPSATPTTAPSPPTTASESPLATPTQVIPPASDIAFPEGSTYWRNQARIPVIVYRAADTLCWYYWTGLEARQRFTGTLTPSGQTLQWNGVLGTYAYPGETPSSAPMTVEFALLGDSGNWKITRTDEPTGGAGAFLLDDAWAPITAKEAAEDFAIVTGLSGYDAPVLTSCPSAAEFGG